MHIASNRFLYIYYDFVAFRKYVILDHHACGIMANNEKNIKPENLFNLIRIPFLQLKPIRLNEMLGSRYLPVEDRRTMKKE